MPTGRVLGQAVLPHRRLTDQQIWAILLYRGESITFNEVKDLASKAERKLRKDPVMRQLALSYELDPDAPEYEDEMWSCIDCRQPFPHTGFYWDCYGNRTSRCRTCHSVRANRKKLENRHE